MSLGDTLRLLRAKLGGITPMDIEAATTLPKGLYRQMEQRYRAVGDDESIGILAQFYGVPADDLRWRLNWSRKALSRALVESVRANTPITLYLWNEQQLSGTALWWDLGAIGLVTSGENPIVVQRHAVERWNPRAAGDNDTTDDQTEDG